MAITVKLNGEEEQLREGMTVSELLEERRVRQEYVTVEISEEIIEKDKYSTTALNEGDEVEFIYYMGGGKESSYVGSR